MDKILEIFKNLAENIDFYRYGVVALVLIVGSLIFGAAGRIVFGKRSMLGSAVSSAIAIVFLCALTVTLPLFGSEFAAYISPLPFVSITEETLHIFSFADKDYTVICGQLLSMVILAFCVSLTDRFLPRGKNLFTWLLFRILTVVLGFAAHYGLLWLLNFMVPNGYSQYAPVILLSVLVLMLLTGALKILVGVILSTANPIVAALYTFFFASVVGRQLTRSVLTTAILTAFVVVLGHLGISTLPIGREQLTLYIPYGVGLLGLWYVVNRIF